jgi:hypothetical protein
MISQAEEPDLKIGRLLTSHLGDTHRRMFGYGVGSLSRQTSKRVCRGDIDDYTTTNVARTIPTSPCFRRLFTHSRSLCAHTKKISSGIDAHDAIKILDVGFGQWGMYTVVNLEDSQHVNVRIAQYEGGSLLETSGIALV